MHRVRHGLLVLAVFGCGPGQPRAEAETIAAEQIQHCVEALCYQLFGCHGAIEPSDDAEQHCQQGCARLIDEFEQAGCATELQALLDCTHAAECKPFLDWFFELPDAACTSEEQQLSDACPDLQIRESF